MLPPHLRKFRAFYDFYGLGAVKNIWLLTCLLLLARTVNLNKIKDYVGIVLNTGDRQRLASARLLPLAGVRANQLPFKFIQFINFLN